MVDGLQATTSISSFSGFLSPLPAVDGRYRHAMLCRSREKGTRAALILDSGALFGIGHCVIVDLHGGVFFVFWPELKEDYPRVS